MDIWTGSCEPVSLPWTDFENVRSIMDAQPPRDGWAIVFWSTGKFDGFGVAIRLSGSYADKSASILSATRTFGRRATSGTSLTGRSAPVLPGTTVMTRFEAEFWTLTTLCKLVAHDDRARARLDDAERVKRLARDLATGMLKPHPLGTGIGRDSTDIHVALQQLGFVHPMNRPLTSVGIPTVSEIADKVEAALRSNRFRVGRESDRAQIEEIVRRDYVDVEPWPFGALVDD